MAIHTFSLCLPYTERMFSLGIVELIGKPQAADDCEREDLRYEKIYQTIGSDLWRQHDCAFDQCTCFCADCK